MKRLFTFGCSFTHYRWPTWADVMSQEFDEYQNWGKVGGGNHYIMYSLTECILRNNISKNDTVGIMWSSTSREDRYIKGKWITPGSIYNSIFSEKLPKYIEHFTDPTGYLLQSLSVFYSVKAILDKIGCKYYFFNMLPLYIKDDSWKKLIFKLDQNKEESMQDLYRETLDSMLPSVYEVIFNNDWDSRNYNGNKNGFRQKWETIKGPDWPSVDTYIDKQWATYPTWFTNELTERGLIPYNIRLDGHPTPLEHFEYLDKLAIPLTEKQKQYAEHWEDIVINGEWGNFGFNPNSPNRF